VFPKPSFEAPEAVFDIVLSEEPVRFDFAGV
jgi:hypothetical protein